MAPGDAVMVDTSSTASAVTVDKTFFDQLPKGRAFYDLIQLAPGARNESRTGGYQIDGAAFGCVPFVLALRMLSLARFDEPSADVRQRYSD